MDIAIIGTGVSGLCAATELIKNHRITFFERSPTIAEQSCSWLAGGMIAPWCERESADEEVILWGQHAIQWWQNHIKTLQQKGSLIIAPPRDLNELKRFARRTTHFEEIDATTLHSLEPDLSHSFQKALYFKQESHLDPRKALKELAQTLQEKGTLFNLETQIRPEDKRLKKFDLIIDTTGFNAKNTLKDLRGVRGEMLILKCKDISFSRPIRMIHPRFPLYCVPRKDNIFMIGATMIESESKAKPTTRSIVELLNAAYILHPAFGEAEIIEINADIRPSFPNHLPRLERKDNILYINGMYRHGFLLAPFMAQKINQMLLEKAA